MTLPYSQITPTSTQTLLVVIRKVCDSHQLTPNLDSAWLFTKLSITRAVRQCFYTRLSWHTLPSRPSVRRRLTHITMRESSYCRLSSTNLIRISGTRRQDRVLGVVVSTLFTEVHNLSSYTIELVEIATTRLIQRRVSILVAYLSYIYIISYFFIKIKKSFLSSGFWSG